MKKTNKEITMELCKGSNGNIERLLAYLIDDEIDLSKLTTSSKSNQMDICIKTEELLYSLGIQYSEDILKSLNFALNNLSNNNKFYNGEKFSTRVDYVFSTTFNNLKSNNNNIFTQALHFVNRNEELYKGLESQHIGKIVFMALLRIVVKDCGVVPYTKSVPTNVKFYKTIPNNNKETKVTKSSRLPETSSVDLDDKDINVDIESIEKGKSLPTQQVDSIINYLSVLGYKIEKGDESKMETNTQEVILNDENAGDVVFNEKVNQVVLMLDKYLESAEFKLTDSDKEVIIGIFNNNKDIICKYSDSNNIDKKSLYSDVIKLVTKELTNDKLVKLLKRLSVKFTKLDNKCINKIFNNANTTSILTILTDNIDMIIKACSDENIEYIKEFLSINQVKLVGLITTNDYNTIKDLFIKHSLANLSFVSSILPLVGITNSVKALFSDDDEDDVDIVGNKSPKINKPNLTLIRTNCDSNPTSTKHRVKEPKEKVLGFAAINNMIKTNGFSFI